MKTSRILATSIASILLASPLFGASWDGTDFLNNSNVGNGSNWQGNIAPPNDGTADLQFQPTAVSFTPNFAVAWSVKSLEAWAGYTFSGQAVTVGTGGLTVLATGDVTFNNRIILTADQTLDPYNGNNPYFNGGLDINARTVTFDPSGSLLSTTGLYGTGTINKTGQGTWHHKSGGVDFHADVNVTYGEWSIDSGPGTQVFSNSSAISVTGTYASMNIQRDSVFNGGSLTLGTATNIAFGSGISVTLQNGTQMTVDSFSDDLDLSGANVTVTGSGSALSANHVGILIESGALSVLAGASASASAGNIGTGGINLGGGGTLLVDGTGSTITAASGVTTWGVSTGTATVTISNNSVATLKQVDVTTGAFSPNATVNVTVSSGADVTSDALHIGTFSNAASAGTVTLTGAGTTWTQNATSAGYNLYVGDASNATGTLNVNDGATFTTGIARAVVYAKGIIAIGGGIFNANADVLLTGSGALLTKTVGSQFNLAAGKTLTVQGGADVSFDGVYTTGGGHITVDGSGSTFTMQTAGLNISAGSVLTLSGSGLFGGTVTTAIGGSPTTVDGASGVVITSGTFVSNGDLSLIGTGTTLTRTLPGVFLLAAGKTLSVAQGADAIFTDNYALTNANVMVAGSGSTWTQTDSGTLTIGAAAVGTAAVTVQSNGAFSTGTGAVTLAATGTVNVAGGTFTVNGPLSGSGAIVLTAGTLDLGTNNLSIAGGGFLGGNVTLAAGQTLLTSGTTTVNSGKSLTLAGATYRTGAVVNNGAFTFTSGLLGITGAGGLTIGAGGLLGGTFTLAAGSALEVTNTTGVSAGGTFTMTGGSFTSGNLTNFGTVTLSAGIVSLATPLINVSGGRIFLPGTVPIGVAITNAGQITLQNGISILGGAGGITNTGLINGGGTVAKSVTNSAPGEIRADSGKTLTFTGANGANTGALTLLGGTLSFAQQLTNTATGSITGVGYLNFPTTAVATNAGLVNAGTVTFTAGASQIHGTVQMQAGSRLIVNGGATASFFNDFNHSGLEVKTTAASGITFLGAVRGAGGFTGTGTTTFEGGYSPGNSAALIMHAGSAVFGALNTLTMELGGTARGTQYDALNVAGKITLGGTLTVPLLSGFQPQFGNVFNLFDWGTTAGTFSTVTLPALATGLLWNQANLYTAGELQVMLDLAVASRTWDGGGGNNAWSTNNNWATDVQPLNNGAASVIFAGNARLFPAVDTPWNVAAITFDNTAGAFTINGPQGITIGAGGIVNNDTQTQTITAAITLSADEFFNAAAGDLRISSVALAAHTLTLMGANDITLAGASGTGTVDKNNAGTLDIIGAFGTGGVTLNANTGTTNIGASETLAALNIGGGAIVTLGAIPPSPAPEFDDGNASLGTPAHAVPEPGTASLILIGTALLGFRSQRKT